jgi:hypothetical protein
MSAGRMQNEGKVLLQIRIPPNLKRLLVDIARLRGTSLNDVVREFIMRSLAELSYLSSEERKALGVTVPRVEKIKEGPPT